MELRGFCENFLKDAKAAGSVLVTVKCCRIWFWLSKDVFNDFSIVLWQTKYETPNISKKRQISTGHNVWCIFRILFDTGHLSRSLVCYFGVNSTWLHHIESTLLLPSDGDTWKIPRVTWNCRTHPKIDTLQNLQQSSFYTVVENESVFKNRLRKCKEKTRYHSISCDFMLPGNLSSIPIWW